jgi:integrase/recombinase XerD
MQDSSYRSVYGMHIHQFIEMKRTLGFKYKTGAVHINQLDVFAFKEEETSPGITKSLADKWCEKRPNESDGYHYTRVCILTEFSAFLSQLGIASFMPRLPKYPKSTFVPHIYTEKELTSLFEAVDTMIIQKRAMNNSILSLPALLRLLYSTGLRISEAIALKNQDINLEANYLVVRSSKSGKERMLPISPSLSAVCKQYIEHRDRLPLGFKRSEYFFVQLNGHKLGNMSIRTWFKRCLEKAGIPFVGHHQGPRVHDLRHTCAVHAMAQMAMAGNDLYVSLPVLSNYLGHASIRATDPYVRLTANMYPELLKDVDMVCLNVFPKYKNYETD